MNDLPLYYWKPSEQNSQPQDGSVITGYNSHDSMDASPINVDYLTFLSLLLSRGSAHKQYYVYKILKVISY